MALNNNSKWKALKRYWFKEKKLENTSDNGDYI